MFFLRFFYPNHWTKPTLACILSALYMPSLYSFDINTSSIGDNSLLSYRSASRRDQFTGKVILETESMQSSVSETLGGATLSEQFCWMNSEGKLAASVEVGGAIPTTIEFSDGGTANSVPGLSTDLLNNLAQASMVTSGKMVAVNDLRDPKILDSTESTVDDNDGVRNTIVHDRESGSNATLRVTASVKDAKHRADMRELMEENARLKVEQEKQAAELSATKAELEVIRNGLGELLEKLHESEEKNKTIQTRFAGMLDFRTSDESRLTVRLLEQWQKLSEQGQTLSGRVSTYCSQIDSLIADVELTEIQQAELSLALDGLKSELRKFSMATQSSEKGKILDGIRIFAVYPEIGVVVLPVGINHGVFNGLVLYGKGLEEPIRLRIISVRSQMSAAIVLNSDISMLASGMELHVDVNKLKD